MQALVGHCVRPRGEGPGIAAPNPTGHMRGQTAEATGRRLAAVRSRDTAPELIVRRLLHGLGFRFRLHRRDLPGRPDIVLPKHHLVIQVHGCFWHRHCGCPYSQVPITNTEFWQTKFRRNVERDARVRAELEALGWRVLVVSECETRDVERLAARLRAALGDGASA